MRPHERWIGTELIGFDATQPDLGVAGMDLRFARRHLPDAHLARLRAGL